MLLGNKSIFAEIATVFSRSVTVDAFSFDLFKPYLYSPFATASAEAI